MDNEHALSVVFAILIIVVIFATYAVKTVNFVHRGGVFDLPAPRKLMSLLPKRQMLAMSVIQTSLDTALPTLQDQICKALKDLQLRGYDVLTLSRVFDIKAATAQPHTKVDNGVQKGGDAHCGSELVD
jgi:hypothetical protein